jgi:hypothetical protein
MRKAVVGGVQYSAHEEGDDDDLGLHRDLEAQCDDAW